MQLHQHAATYQLQHMTQPSDVNFEQFLARNELKYVEQSANYACVNFYALTFPFI